MHAIPASDPIAWLLVSYLLGTLACGAWTLLVRTIRSVTARNPREPAC